MKTKMNYLLVLFGLIFFMSCSKDDPSPGTDETPVKIEFRESTQNVAENNTVGARIFIDAESPVRKDGTFTVKIEGLDGLVYGQGLKTLPAASNNTITFAFPKDSSYVSFQLIPVDNNIVNTNGKVRLSLVDVGGGAVVGNQVTSEVTIVDDENKELFAYTSFEEPTTTIDILYYDTFSHTVDHDLINNADQPTVNYTSIGGELGFKASYVNSRDSLGLTDGDFVGVTKATVLVNQFSDGKQGYEMSDTDGRMILKFDEVDISPYFNVNIQLDLWVYDRADDGIEYEGNDFINIYVLVDGEQVEILNTLKEKGDLIDDTPELFNKWNTVAGVIGENHSKAQLVIEFDSNSINEIVYFDNIKFIGVK